MKRKATPARKKAPPKSAPAAPPKPRLPGAHIKIPSHTDLSAQFGPTVATLTDVRLLAVRQIKIEDEIAELNERLADAGRRLAQVKQEDLPMAFDAAGIKRLVLPEGFDISVADFITGSIKPENIAAAHQWLRANKLGGLIKNQVKVAFGKGDDKKAKALAAFLKKQKVEFERTEGVHPMTLKAFVREQLEAGRDLPATIEVTKVPTATIKRPKE